VRPDRRFVDVDATAGAIRGDQFVVFHYRGVKEKLISSDDAVDFDFHDADVGHDGAEMALTAEQRWP
jgi:hypothetical protein